MCSSDLKLRPAFLRRRLRTRAIAIRERQKAHGRMIDGKLRTQSTDAARADDADAELRPFQSFLHLIDSPREAGYGRGNINSIRKPLIEFRHLRWRQQTRRLRAQQ